MKIILLATIAALTVATSAAFASESRGANGLRGDDTAGVIAPVPHSLDRVSIIANDVLTTNGSEGGLQSVNSLPVGFTAGTVAFEQARSVTTYLQSHSGSRATARPLAFQFAPAAPQNG